MKIIASVLFIFFSYAISANEKELFSLPHDRRAQVVFVDNGNIDTVFVNQIIHDGDDLKLLFQEESKTVKKDSVISVRIVLVF